MICPEPRADRGCQESQVVGNDGRSGEPEADAPITTLEVAAIDRHRNLAPIEIDEDLFEATVVQAQLGICHKPREISREGRADLGQMRLVGDQDAIPILGVTIRGLVREPAHRRRAAGYGVVDPPIVSGAELSGTGIVIC